MNNSLSPLSNIADPQRAAKIYYFSFGIPRYVKKLLEEATKSALRKGKDSLEDSDFEHAFHRITRSIRPYAINPFNKDSFDVHLAIQKEREQEDKLIIDFCCVRFAGFNDEKQS